MHNASDLTRTRRAQGDPSLTLLQFSLISMKTAVFFCCLDFSGGDFNFVRLLALKHFLVTWRAAKCCAWQGSFTSASKEVQLYILCLLFIIFAFQICRESVKRKYLSFGSWLAVKDENIGRLTTFQWIGKYFQSFVQFINFKSDRWKAFTPVHGPKLSSANMLALNVFGPQVYQALSFKAWSYRPIGRIDQLIKKDM